MEDKQSDLTASIYKDQEKRIDDLLRHMDAENAAIHEQQLRDLYRKELIDLSARQCILATNSDFLYQEVQRIMVALNEAATLLRKAQNEIGHRNDSSTDQAIDPNILPTEV